MKISFKYTTIFWMGGERSWFKFNIGGFRFNSGDPYACWDVGPITVHRYMKKRLKPSWLKRKMIRALPTCKLWRHDYLRGKYHLSIAPWIDVTDEELMEYGND